MTAARPSAERAANTDRVLAALAPDLSLTQTELREATGLSRPTLAAILRELLAEGWIVAVAPTSRAGAAGAGRPARSFRIDPDAITVAGVDVGLHAVRVVVADATGARLHAVHVDVAPDAAGAERLTLVQQAIAGAARATGRDVSALAAICVGVPGIVDAAGRIRRSSVIADWSGFDVGRAIGRWAGCPVDVVNDANLAAVGEHWTGAARMCDDVVYLHLGRRTSAGLLLDGRVHPGRTGAAGEIGSIPALFLDTPSVLIEPDAAQDDPRIPEVFTAAAAGDEGAAARVEEFGRRVAESVEMLTKILDPDVVVLGGGLSRAGAALLDVVTRHVAFVDGVAPPVVLGALADEAVTSGGVRRALLLAAREEPLLRPLLAAGTARTTRPPADVGGREPETTAPERSA
ncbi:ROK family transcriptional regulator [Beutenbergia cavernae]|uniref:ROK family transcriptional regulator n=1 Tax=Beutenbergia cavernae TaxID=84757 RepID=UPI00019ACEF7|nr:ROK family transcriptional regulator [Beutenbergia cavernae]